MSAATALAALAAYTKNAPEDRTQIAALIADLLELVDEPDAVLEEARTRYDKEHPETNPARTEHRRLDAADEVAEHHRENWRAIRRSLGSLRGNITRAENAGDGKRVARLRVKEHELRIQERAARLAFSEAAIRTKGLRSAWLERMDSRLALIQDDE